VEKVFGDNRQIICSTHIDRKHIHNHFAVATYSNTGEHWESNLKTLNRVRDISDEICKKYNVKTIDSKAEKKEKAEKSGVNYASIKGGGVSYKEWDEKGKGTSWKENLRKKLDELILNENLKSLDDLLNQLKNEDYVIKRGKYITIKPPEAERGARLYKLGVGYSEKDLEYRLQNRDKEFSLAAIFQKYKGIQVEYALCLRQIQITVYQKKPNPRRRTIDDIKQMTDVLFYIRKYDIHKQYSFEDRLNDLTNEYNEKTKRLTDIKNEINDLQKICDDYPIFKILDAKIPEQNTKIPYFTKDEEKEYSRVAYVSDYTDESISRYRQYILKLKSEAETLAAQVEKLKTDKDEASKMLSVYNYHTHDYYADILENVKAEMALREEAERLRAEQVRDEKKQRIEKMNSDFENRYRDKDGQNDADTQNKTARTR